MIIRHVGQGWDVHRLGDGDHLRLGGVNIPFSKALVGHSDADVLCHAVIDAILGGAKLGDIGRLFPDSDDVFRNADSLLLLEEVMVLLTAGGWRVVNVDATILAEQPKLAPYIPSMEGNLAQAIGMPERCVSVKAKTAEGLGSIGAGLCVQALAVVMLEREE